MHSYRAWLPVGLVICTTSLLAGATEVERIAIQEADASETKLVPHVDERVELLSIVFRLAGNPEYNMSQLKIYTADIDSYFRDTRATLPSRKRPDSRKTEKLGSMQ